MFGSKTSLTDKIKESLAEFVDEKFEDYRGQISNDLSQGLGGLAGLIAIWSLVIICTLFVALSIALLLGWFFSFWWSTLGYVFSFLLVSSLLIGLAFCVIRYKKTWIEAPVYKIISQLLNNPNYRETNPTDIDNQEDESIEKHTISSRDTTDNINQN